jgi:hypothetical protein
MRTEIGFNPNCSEAVFRFYTDDPKVAQEILQAFADEVRSHGGYGLPVPIQPPQRMAEAA